MKQRTKAAAAVVLGGGAAVLSGAWYAYRTAFRADRRRAAEARDYPSGEAYGPYREACLANIEKLLAEPFQSVTLRSRDGLRLHGRYYAGHAGAPLFLFFHGYRSTAQRDGSGGYQLCRKNGWNVLMADQRCHGESEGRTITFGIRERYDCLNWVQEAVRRFGADTPIFLVGVSMGAATVLMASDLDLPPQVKGIWADCGYSSPEAVLRHTASARHLPQGPSMALVRLGGRLFGGGLNVGECTAESCVKRARVPILLIHGEGDSVVPCAMAREMKDACAAPVTLLTVPNAPHGMSYYADTAAYTAAVEQFVGENLAR